MSDFAREMIKAMIVENINEPSLYLAFDFWRESLYMKEFELLVEHLNKEINTRIKNTGKSFESVITIILKEQRVKLDAIVLKNKNLQIETT